MSLPWPPDHVTGVRARAALHEDVVCVEQADVAGDRAFVMKQVDRVPCRYRHRTWRDDTRRGVEDLVGAGRGRDIDAEVTRNGAVILDIDADARDEDGRRVGIDRASFLMKPLSAAIFTPKMAASMPPLLTTLEFLPCISTAVLTVEITSPEALTFSVVWLA